MEKEFISVIIPAYNEQRRLRPTLEKVGRYVRDNFRDFEIIVVDDGSTDGTASIVPETDLPGMKLLRNEGNMGKGYSIRRGILSSSGGLVLMSDADMSTPIEEVGKLMRFLNDGYDIAIGSRGLRESDIAVRQPWYRERMGKTFNLMVRLLLVGGIRDTQCGFKLFRGEAARRVFEACRIAGFGFDVEALFIAGKMGYRVKEVPIRWLNSPESRVRVFSDSAMMFLELLRIRVDWMRGRYKETGS